MELALLNQVQIYPTPFKKHKLASEILQKKVKIVGLSKTKKKSPRKAVMPLTRIEFLQGIKTVSMLFSAVAAATVAVLAAAEDEPAGNTDPQET